MPYETLPMTPAQQEMFEAAHAAFANAHAPYSKYPVGAAVRTAGGRIYAGCNVENAAYPQGWCAEASAIAAMVTAGERVIVEVLTLSDGTTMGTCCGGCRQKIREFAALDTPIHSCGPDGLRASFTLEGLLPFSFGPENLLP
ncbi:MAG: cytidine deaminase [Actinomycetota bacterium]|nr:cytidine deaminase [Actinomycetota bacterium]